MSEEQAGRGPDETFCPDSGGEGEGHHFVSHSVNAGPVRWVDICSFCGFISSERLRLQVDPPDQRSLAARTRWPFPDEGILGVEDGKWPVHLFTEVSHAESWVSADPIKRRARRVRLALVNEMKYIPPTQSRLEDA